RATGTRASPGRSPGEQLLRQGGTAKIPLAPPNPGRRSWGVRQGPSELARLAGGGLDADLVLPPVRLRVPRTGCICRFRICARFPVETRGRPVLSPTRNPSLRKQILHRRSRIFTPQGVCDSAPRGSRCGKLARASCPYLVRSYGQGGIILLHAC